jgi:hypothetical protein
VSALYREVGRAISSSFSNKLKSPNFLSYEAPRVWLIFLTPLVMGSIVLPHLRTAWHVDQAILSEEERLVVIRFGRDHDPDCKTPPLCHDRNKN